MWAPATPPRTGQIFLILSWNMSSFKGIQDRLGTPLFLWRKGLFLLMSGTGLFMAADEAYNGRVFMDPN
ncbi:hypothetical protein GCM10010911_47760 [Paenibacillus nasutitermitis]|uniref:Uncharacterized protein n=1 Tax=Paenibacillus nasutitermitis TaxID=1652958 RepID=A0A916ZAM1_9BACL|nr:hypothetical protein GCM10010911_47760 [Paenibacillus nasutitermitis]